MHGDTEEPRYFAYLNLFVFSMLFLILASNFVLLLVGWGMVGLSSYLLIGFWHPRKSAVAAAKKAFVMNAVGDAGMAIGIFLIFRELGTSTTWRSSPERTQLGVDTRRSTGSACCCWSARWRSRRSSRCTPGSRTPWRARLRSPR